MKTDYSYDKIRVQLGIQFSHTLTMLRLAEDSSDSVCMSLCYYCRGILNGSKLLWEYTDQMLVWTALYVKVEQRLSTVIDTSIQESLKGTGVDKEFHSMVDNPAYLESVLNSFDVVPKGPEENAKDQIQTH